MKLLNCMLYDIKFQIRHKFYLTYLFVSVLYITLINLLPNTINLEATVLIIFTDPSVLGAFFIGAIYLLEKAQNTFEGLFITPIKIYEYIFSKVITLSLIACISSFLIVTFSYNDKINYFYLLLGVILTSVFYTLLGLIIALYSKSTNHYILNSMLLVIFVIPIIEYLKIANNFIFYILPTKASLLLIDGAFTNITIHQFIYATLMLLSWSIIAYLLAHKLFLKKVIFKIGG